MPCTSLLEGRYDVLSKGDHCKWAFRDVIVRYRGEEAFNSPRIGSQCLGEPVPLDSELHTCFSVLHVMG